MFKQICHIVFFLAFSATIQAQTSANAKYSADSIRIGEQFLLNLSFTFQPNDTNAMVWPEFDNFLTDEIEIIDKSDIDTFDINQSDNVITLEQKLVLTSFEVGALALPAISFLLNDSAHLTSPYQLIVSTVEVDTAKGIYDIKPIYEVNYKLSNKINDYFVDNWYWIVIAILLLVIIFLVVKYLRKPQPEVIIEKPKIPAHESALSILRALVQSKAWESDDKKAYYSSVTDTVRKYLEERFEIQAMEETTIEIIKDLKYSDIISKDKFFLQEILQQADMVKFAKFKPDNQDGQIVLEKSIEFVERTKSDNLDVDKKLTKGE